MSVTVLHRTKKFTVHKHVCRDFLGASVSEVGFEQRWCKCVSQLSTPAELCESSRQACLDVKVLPPLSDPQAETRAKRGRRGTPNTHGLMVICRVELQQAVRGCRRVVGSGSCPSFDFLSVHRGSHCSCRGQWSHLTTLPHSHALLQGKEEFAATVASNRVTERRLCRTPPHQRTRDQTSRDKDVKMYVLCIIKAQIKT